MTVAIVGSRGLTEVDFSLYLPKDVTKIISGGAKGIDLAAANYAKAQGIELEEILPAYDRYGRAAPVVRNRQIVLSADLVLLFWDGISRGTKSSLEICRKEGRPYKLFFLQEDGSCALREEG